MIYTKPYPAPMRNADRWAAFRQALEMDLNKNTPESRLLRDLAWREWRRDYLFADKANPPADLAGRGVL